MKDELVTFETAKLAKEKGFNIPVQSFYHDNEIQVNPFHFIDDCLYCYNDQEWKDKYHCRLELIKEPFWLAPTQSLLQKWLREKHGYYVLVSFHASVTSFIFQIDEKDKMIFAEDAFTYETYEQALEKGLQEALKLIK